MKKRLIPLTSFGYSSGAISTLICLDAYLLNLLYVQGCYATHWDPKKELAQPLPALREYTAESETNRQTNRHNKVWWTVG